MNKLIEINQIEIAQVSGGIVSEAVGWVYKEIKPYVFPLSIMFLSLVFIDVLRRRKKVSKSAAGAVVIVPIVRDDVSVFGEYTYHDVTITDGSDTYHMNYVEL